MRTSESLFVEHWKREEVLGEPREDCVELLGPSKNLNTAVRVNFVPGKLFCLVAERRLHPRHAAAWAHIGQFLLNRLR